MLVVAAGLLTWGCGGGDDETSSERPSPAQSRAFAGAYRPIATDLLVLKTQYRGATQAINPDTGPRAAPTFARWAREMRTLARRTAALPAPGALRERRDRLADFMNAVARDLGNLAAAARRDDQPAAVNAIENARGHTQGLDAAQRELVAATRR